MSPVGRSAEASRPSPSDGGRACELEDCPKTPWELRYDELHARDDAMPGPWTWEIHDHSMATLCGGGEDAIVGFIMSVGPCGACADHADPKEWKWGRCQTPSLANARLIAAAPDLLEALRECRSVLAMLTEPESFRSTTVHQAWAQAVAAEAKARAAIARATGGEA